MGYESQGNCGRVSSRYPSVTVSVRPDSARSGVPKHLVIDALACDSLPAAGAFQRDHALPILCLPCFSPWLPHATGRPAGGLCSQIVLPCP